MTAERARLPAHERLVKYVGLAVMILGGLFPLGWILLTSLKDEGELQKFPVQYLTPTPDWGNYGRVFSEQPFARFFLNSLVVSGVSTVLCVVVAALAAYALSRLRLRYR